jgi:hypothetical protein
LSALCKAVAPQQVQVTYSAQDPAPFRVEWSGELGPVSFAGPSPDEAAERALQALRAHRFLPPAPPARICARPELRSPLARRASATAAGVAREPQVEGSASATDPSVPLAFTEAMRERIAQLVEARAAAREQNPEPRAPGADERTRSTTGGQDEERRSACKPALRLVRS